jgi:cytochrome c oxidase cbb3-type subunit 2
MNATLQVLRQWLAQIIVLIIVPGLAYAQSGQSPVQTTQEPPFSWSAFEPGKQPTLTPQTVALGEEVFLRNCSGCHGQNGDGAGWLAGHLYPKPRNFTRGVFRFKRSETGGLPSDADLFRTVSAGIHGTAMPAWRFSLSEEKRWAVVAYLKTFSNRFREEGPGSTVELGTTPPGTAGRADRGMLLFTKVGCAECHGPEGYGNGRAAEGMTDSFGNSIRPRNFHRQSEFKRGRTLQDIALTIATGNDGTPMPSFLNALTKNEIWNLATYVTSLEVEPEPPTPMGAMNGCPMMGGTFVGGPMMGAPAPAGTAGGSMMGGGPMMMMGAPMMGGTMQGPMGPAPNAAGCCSPVTGGTTSSAPTSPGCCSSMTMTGGPMMGGTTGGTTPPAPGAPGCCCSMTTAPAPSTQP